MVDQLGQRVSTGTRRSNALAQTTSMLARSMPPRKTEHTASSRRAASLNRSWLQAIVARSVRCRSGTSRAADQQAQRVLEPRQDRRRRQQLHPRRRQLDRQRQPVEASHDPAIAAAFSSSTVKPGTEAAARAANNCTDSQPATDAAETADPRLRNAQRRHRELLLPRQVQRRAARDQDPRSLLCGEQVSHEAAGGEHLLEVVQDQQDAPGRAR